MFHTSLEHAPFSLQHDTPTSSSLFYPPNRTNPCAPQPGLLCGRFAVQSPLTGCEPNALVQVSSTDATTTLLPSRKASIGSTYKSGEDIVTTPAVSEVDERSDLGMLASPLLTRERGRERERQVRHHSEFITLIETSSVTRSSHVRTSTERLVAMCTQEKIESGLKCCTGVFFIQKENGFFVSVKKSATSLVHELLMLLEEHKLLCQGTLKRNITRNYLLSEVRSKLEMRQLRVAYSALQESGLQHHSQRMELHQANQWSDHSKRDELAINRREEHFLQEDRMRGLQKFAVQELKERNN